MENRSILCNESPSYSLLFYRKDGWLRGLEISMFLLGFLFLLLPYFPFRSLSFVIGLLVLAAVVMTSAPALYLAIFRPRYTLYSDRVAVRKGFREKTIPLQNGQSLDLYYLQHENKRIPLLVSNDFLSEVELRLEMMRHGWKCYGK